MTKQEQRINKAIYRIRSKEKMIRTTYTQGTGTTRAYLENLIKDAKETTRQELEEQVEQEYFTEAEADEILEALSAMAEIRQPCPKTLIATFPEFKLNELYVHSVAIETDDSNGRNR